MAAELWLAHSDLHPTAPPELLTVRPPVLSALDTEGGGRTYVYDYALVEGAALRRLGRDPAYAVLQPPAGFDPRVRAAFATRLYPVPPVAATWGVQGSYDIDLTGLQPLPLWGLNLSLRHAEGTPAHAKPAPPRRRAQRRLARRAGLRGPSSRPPLPEPVSRADSHVPGPGHVPRARIPSRARALEGREALAALFDPAFDPAAEVILSGSARAKPRAAAQRAAGSVRITELRVDRVRLEAGSTARESSCWPTPGITAGAPGWTGAPAPVLVANVAFRAVAVAAGRHVVEMRYRPRAALVGLALTGLSFLGAGRRRSARATAAPLRARRSL